MKLMILWIVGLSGAGKTTIGRIAASNLRSQGHPTVVIDGDEFREAVGQEPTYDNHGRRTNSLRIARFSLLLEANDVVVVACVLSIFPEHRQELRRRALDYLEVYVKADMEDLLSRDYKGLYAGALTGEVRNVVGVDITFPEPTEADIVIHNRTNTSDPAVLASIISNAVVERIQTST